ncbi:ribonuclease III domain-containing protein [Methanolobus sp. ZRKC3]|uniref:ribonuclease III family protein n=1 Tax=Methanolobus sp. ZRKC3 TaxID=3125786 RepID=UPI0032434A05
MKLNDDLTVNSDDLETFQKIINVQFTDSRFLIQALTHGSLFNGDSEKLDIFKKRNNLEEKDYEKLEFLGDSVLGLIVAEYAYYDKKIDEYTKSTGKSIEGVSTDLKKVLVSNKSLKSIAKKIDLENYVLCEPHVNIDGKLPDIIEALIGSIYLNNHGFCQVRKFVYSFFDLEKALDKLSSLNPKGRLKEIFDKQGSDFEYRILCEHGMDHEKSFTVGLFVDDKQKSEGYGKRIRDAEKDAAEKYLITST